MSKFDITRNLAISAGAGTGKTYTLSRRYINILLGFNFFRTGYEGTNDFSANTAISRRADPGEIVTITYTEAGAGEMRERINGLISSTLAHIDGRTNSDKGLLAAIDFFRDQREYIRDRLLNCQAQMIYANISTIHSFALGLIKLNSDLIQIDLSPTIISSTEKRKAFKESVRFALEKNEGDALALLSVIGNFKLNQVAEKYLYDGKFRRYLDAYQTSQISSADLLTIYQKITVSEHFPAILSVARDYHELEACATNPEKHKAYQNYILSVYQSLLDFQPLEGRATPVFQVSEEGKEIRDKMTGSLKKLRSLPISHRSDVETVFTETLSKVRSIVRDCYDTYLGSMIESSYIDFDLIVSIAAEAVANGQIQADYQYYMIDEFQDTNETQWNMLRTLAKESSANIFLVGDEKQSIYSFQGAEVETFGMAIDQVDLVPIDMTDNRRSTEEILRFANETFAPLFAKNSSDTDLTTVPDEFKGSISELDKLRSENVATLPYTDLTYPDDSAKAWNTSVTYLVTEDSWTEDDSRTQDDAEFESIANLLLKIKNGELERYENVRQAMLDRKKAVAILFNSRNGMSVLRDKLKLRGIPCLANFREDFFQSKEVIEIFHVLQSIERLNRDPERKHLDTYAFNLVGALRSGVLRASDQMIYDTFNSSVTSLSRKFRLKEFDPFIDASKSLSISDLIAFIINRSNLKTIYSAYEGLEQRSANLNKLVQFAADFEKEHLSDLRLFVEELEEAIYFAEDSDESMAAFDAKGMDSVILTTIHASKGLQYPMVIMPQMTKNLLKAGGSDSFKFGRVSSDNTSEGMSLVGFKVNNEKPIAYHLAATLTAKRDIEERKRLFYVALTRAESHIVVSIPEYTKSISGTYLQFLSEQYAQDLNSTVNEFAQEDAYDTTGTATKSFKRVTLLKIKNQETAIDIRTKKWTTSPKNAFKPIQIKSSGEGITASIKDEEIFTLSDANILGTAFHELVASSFEIIEDENKVDDAIAKLLKKHQLARVNHGYLKSLAKNLVNHPLYPEIKNADERYFEKDFAFQTSEGVKRGSIDLLYRTGEDWNIIDFKTNNLSGKTEEQVTLDHHYDQQLQYYSEAIEKSLKIQVCRRELMYVNR